MFIVILYGTFVGAELECGVAALNIKSLFSLDSISVPSAMYVGASQSVT